jgi:hypothetical protein
VLLNENGESLRYVTKDNMRAVSKHPEVKLTISWKIENLIQINGLVYFVKLLREFLVQNYYRLTLNRF